MEKFESVFTDLDTHTEVMENTMSSATTLSTPENQVEGLMQQVAEENGLDIVNKLEENPISSKIPTVDTLTHEQEDKLSRRLAQLRDPA